jgi:hypothetical protein
VHAGGGALCIALREERVEQVCIEASDPETRLARHLILLARGMRLRCGDYEDRHERFLPESCAATTGVEASPCGMMRG